MACGREILAQAVIGIYGTLRAEAIRDVMAGFEANGEDEGWTPAELDDAMRAFAHDITLNPNILLEALGDLLD